MKRADKEKYFFGSVLLLANKFQIWGDSMLEGITFKQFFLLIFISKMDSRTPTVREVAEFTGTTRQNVKKMLETLEKEGFVELNPSTTDARALSVVLTPKTFEFFKANDAKANDAMTMLFSKIPNHELESGIEMTDSLLQILNEHALGKQAADKLTTNLNAVKKARI